MPVITITITESPLQLLIGIPQSISVVTNIPATIFYTLDGTEPTDLSDVVVGTIRLPTDQSNVTFKAYATNGIDTSAIITQNYVSTPSVNTTRRPHNTVIGLSPSGPNPHDLFPFGSHSPTQSVRYGNTGGVVVDGANDLAISDGYDGTATGTPSNYLDNDISEYKIKYSETNSIGERGRNIGTLPATVRLHVPASINTSNDANSKLLNPRALVIIQDGRNPPDDQSIPMVNRQFFNLHNPETHRDGATFGITANEGGPITGTFLRQHFNPHNQTITYYYFDSSSCRWIISIEPFRPRNPTLGSLHQVVFSSRENGSQYVYPWVPFKRSHLR